MQHTEAENIDDTKKKEKENSYIISDQTWLRNVLFVTYVNLLWKTPNVTSSPDVRLIGAVSLWLLTDVPYLDESFSVRV